MKSIDWSVNWRRVVIMTTMYVVATLAPYFMSPPGSRLYNDGQIEVTVEEAIELVP